MPTCPYCWAELTPGTLHACPALELLVPEDTTAHFVARSAGDPHARGVLVPRPTRAPLDALAIERAVKASERQLYTREELIRRSLGAAAADADAYADHPVDAGDRIARRIGWAVAWLGTAYLFAIFLVALRVVR